MKKIFLTSLFLIVATICYSQIYQPALLVGKKEHGISTDRFLSPPTGCGSPALPTVLDSSLKKAGIYYDTCNKRLWLYDSKLLVWDSVHIGVAGSSGGVWGTITGNLPDQIDLYDSLLARLKNSDTASMLLNYRHWLAGYLTSVDTTDIASFYSKVRSLFSATYPIQYSNGNYSLDTGAGKWRSENYFDAKYTPQIRSITTGWGLTGGGDFSIDRDHEVDSNAIKGLVGWGGSIPTWQQTLTAGSTLTGNNSSNGLAYTLTHNTLGFYANIRRGGANTTQLNIDSTIASIGSNDGSGGVSVYNDSTIIIGDIVKIRTLPNFADTTNFKQVVVNTTGTGGTLNQLYQATYWPGGGGGSVNVRYSIVKGTGDSLQLENDELNPGNDMFYGTTGDGVKSWIAQSVIASSKQDGIQFRDEGTALGAVKTATVVNFIGAGVTATRNSDSITVNITSGGGTTTVSQASNIDMIPTDTIPATITIPGRYDGFSIMGQFPSGKMVIVYRSGSVHGFDGDAVMKMRVSTDQGKTWDDTSIIHSESGVDIRNYGGGVTPTGRLIVSFIRYLGGVSYGGQYYIYSDDEGVTWSSPVSLSDEGEAEYSPYGALISIADDKLLMTWYGFTGTTYTIYAVRSSDNGTTWDSPITIATGLRQYTETSTTYVGGGQILALSRTEDSVCFNQWKSLDNGLTWVDQGLVLFDNWSESNPTNAWITTFIGLDGRRMVACYYGERFEMKLRVIYGAAVDLIKNGVSGWDSRTRVDIATPATSVPLDFGYPAVIHPVGGKYAIGTYMDSIGKIKFFTYPPKNQIWEAPDYKIGARITPRVYSVTSPTSVTVNSDSTDIVSVVSLSAGLTINAPAGTPRDGQLLTIRINALATPQALTWNAIFRAIGDYVLPSVTVATSDFAANFMYNTDAVKWDLVNITYTKNFANTNLTQTAARTYAGAGYAYTFNNLGDWKYHIGPNEFDVYGNSDLNKFELKYDRFKLYSTDNADAYRANRIEGLPSGQIQIETTDSTTGLGSGFNVNTINVGYSATEDYRGISLKSKRYGGASNTSLISLKPDSALFDFANGAWINRTTEAASNMTNKKVWVWDNVTNRMQVISKDSVGGSGYTNLTQFVDQTAWRLFYSNTSGDVTELAFGDAAKVLTSNGAAAAPTWETPSAGGLTVGTTTIANSATRRILYDSAGVLSNNDLFKYNADGELQIGSGSDLGDFKLQVTGHATITGDITVGSLAYVPLAVLFGTTGSNSKIQETSAGHLDFLDRNNSAWTEIKVSNVIATGDVTVADEAYGAGWNGSTEVPTKNALYDKIETLGGGGLTIATTTITGGSSGNFLYNASGILRDTILGSNAFTSTAYVPQTTTVAGFALSGNVTLADLTATNGSLTFSGTYNGSTARTIGLTSRTLWGQTFDGTGNVSGSLTAVGDITGGASNMTILSGTGASRTMILQTTTSGSTPTTFLTGNADQSATFANIVNAGNFTANATTVPVEGMYRPTGAGNLGFAVSSGAELLLTSTAFSPAADGGNSLGTTALGWQNLFGNTGFVMNVENGDWVATHTAGILTVGTGTLKITTPTNTATSVVTIDGTQTLTNKRRTLRAPAVSQSATPTINTDVTDVAHITGLAQAITSMTTNLSGTPIEGDVLRIDITDNGTARGITWGASFEASTVPLPTTTVLSTRLDCIFLWNTVTSKWRIVGCQYLWWIVLLIPSMFGRRRIKFNELLKRAA
ncbi:hypothetical protein GAMM_230015 [Gammaproteobacteria bacterium]